MPIPPLPAPAAPAGELPAGGAGGEAARRQGARRARRAGLRRRGRRGGAARHPPDHIGGVLGGGTSSPAGGGVVGVAAGGLAGGRRGAAVSWGCPGLSAARPSGSDRCHPIGPASSPHCMKNLSMRPAAVLGQTGVAGMRPGVRQAAHGAWRRPRAYATAGPGLPLTPWPPGLCTLHANQGSLLLACLCRRPAGWTSILRLLMSWQWMKRAPWHSSWAGGSSPPRCARAAGRQPGPVALKAAMWQEAAVQ